MVKKGARLLIPWLVFLIVLVSLCTCQVPPDFPCEGEIFLPVPITVGSPHQGTIEGGKTSYYKFFAAGSCSHTVALTHTQSDMSWKVLDRYNTYKGGCDDWYGPADEIAVTQPLLVGEPYYLRVMEYDDVDGTFTLTVTCP